MLFLRCSVYMEREPFMTVEEVAAYLRVDKYTIYRLVSKGKIPGFKVGHQWRFKQSMLERWLRSNTNIRDTH
jgi:excisionase family DNA binding protein